MNIKEVFNNIAFKWDEICKHDDEKLKKIIKLSAIKEKSKILDVGTGTGIMIGYLTKTNPLNLTAIDISDNMISIARKKFPKENVNFVVSDIMDYNEEGFDYVFLYSSYPHFSDKNALFKHLHSLMNKDGKIIIAHSESKEKINEIHGKSDYFKNDTLPSGNKTANLMSKYFRINMIIDNEDMYFVSGIKSTFA